ncbi:hypothetical protein FQA39_LY19325 [Lamprigera yunnana]|nr:hypothetical protein FQA39_LY19325 [Lamprigera yunnana]
MRERLRAAATRKAIGYTGAGTVEFPRPPSADSATPAQRGQQPKAFMKPLNPLGTVSALLAAALLAGCASSGADKSAEAAKEAETKAAAEATKPAEPAPPPAAPQATAQFADAKPNQFALQTYATANGEGYDSFSIQFLKGGKVVYKTKDDEGKAVQYRGTWKRSGNQIDVQAKDAKSDDSVSLAYEVRPELTSTDDKYKACKKFAPGLYPLNINGSTDEDLSYSLWPAHLIQKNAAPCAPERKPAAKKGKSKS